MLGIWRRTIRLPLRWTRVFSTSRALTGGNLGRGGEGKGGSGARVGKADTKQQNSRTSNPPQRVSESTAGERSFSKDKYLKFKQSRLRQHIESLGAKKDWREVLRIIDTAVTPLDKYIYSAAITVMGRNRKLNEAIYLFKKSQKEGIEADIYTYASLIDAASKSRDWRSAVLFFEQLEGAGLVANITTFNSLIDACAKCGELNQAIYYFNKLKGSDTKATVHSFNIIINAYRQVSVQI